MKTSAILKVLFIIVCLTMNLTAQRTLPANEHFDYPTGWLVSSSDWVKFGSDAGTSNIFVIDGNLSFTDYPMPAIGRMVQILYNQTTDLGHKLNFTSISGDGNSVYASFLVELYNETPGQTHPFFALSNANPSNTNQGFAFVGLFHVTGQGWKFLIGKTPFPGHADTTATYYNTNQTHLIVIKYKFMSGDLDDSVKIWIDPDLSGPEPTPNANAPVNYTDADEISSVFIRQTAVSPYAYIDAIRIGTLWANAPLPVELSSFSATVLEKGVQLNWETKTEVSNYGFEVQRSEFGVRGSEFKVLGFIEGNGNSNSPKEYSFVDNHVTSGKYSYRLKQIDNDGKYEYSKVIEVDLGNPVKYELDQNYPNPFNPFTTINFSIPQSGNVKLLVYNILGEQVAELINGFKEEGNHSVKFDASSLNSGLYIYKLETNGFTQYKKMTLIK